MDTKIKENLTHLFSRRRKQPTPKPAIANLHIDDMTDLELKNMVHELQVHQIELSVQNEELASTQLQLAEARDQYLALYDRAPVAYFTLLDSGQINTCNMAATHLLGAPRSELIGRYLQAFVQPESQSDFHLHLQRLLHSRTPQITELAMHTCRGEIFVFMESQYVPSEDASIKASWYTALTDITMQKQLLRNLANLNLELEQRVTLRTHEFLESSQRLDAVFNAVPDAILAFDGTGKIEHANRAAEALLEYAQGEIIGLNIRQFTHGAVPQDTDTTLEKLIHEPNKVPLPVNRAEIHICTRSGIRIPAAISIARVDHQDKFTVVVRDIRDIKSLQREVLNTAETERSRISQELHDSIGQDLVGMSMLAKSIAINSTTNEGSSSVVAKQCLNLSSMLDRCVSELRQIIFDLAPLEQQEGGLVSALKKLIAVFNQNSHVECRFTCTGTELDTTIQSRSEVNIQLLRIAKEAIHNAHKHAKAKHIDLILELGSTLRLTIADDGIGMPAIGEVDAKSQGIRIMRYRANLLGGELRLEPNHPNGTRLICEMV